MNQMSDHQLLIDLLRKIADKIEFGGIQTSTLANHYYGIVECQLELIDALPETE